MTEQDRPLRDVLREVEEMLAHKEMNPFDRYCYGRLTRELRALAPLLRDMAVLATCNDVRGDDALIVRARALADELEAR